MSCRICKRDACTESFHSLKEEERAGLDILLSVMGCGHQRRYVIKWGDSEEEECSLCELDNLGELKDKQFDEQRTRFIGIFDEHARHSSECLDATFQRHRLGKPRDGDECICGFSAVREILHPRQGDSQ